MRWINHTAIKTFSRGVHPADHKADTCHLPIRQFPFAPEMVIPLSQHVGKPAIAVVRQGQEVLRGQVIAIADGPMSVPIHAPATGVIQGMDLVPSNKGMIPGIYLKPMPGSTQEVNEGTPCHLETATPDDILQAIQSAGIVGLGGAVFPTHIKLTLGDNKYVDTLIINGVECEPYLTTDHRVMLEQTQDIMLGIRYLLKATGAKRAIIAVEANKPDAAHALNQAIPPGLAVSVQLLKVKYPQGADKILVKTLLGLEVPPGSHSVDIHVVTINVATTAEIGRLLPHGRGVQERVITITGPAVAKKGNYLIPMGTPLRFALTTLGVSKDINAVCLGGPMMGPAVANLDIPITKGVAGFVAFTKTKTERKQRIFACIHCGYCVEACPIALNPSQLGLLAMKKDYARMVHDFHLRECFECGACAYICPSHIPLVQYFRTAKAMYKKEHVSDSLTSATVSIK